MLIVLSPAKKLDYDTPAVIRKATKPQFLDQSSELIDVLRDYSAMDLAELMKLSMNLAELNFERYYRWKPNYSLKESKQCLLAFKGDVYAGLDAETFREADFNFAQDHLRILSGLYGLLRPLDRMLPYRLEMGTRLPTDRGKNLYEFWGDRITSAINRQLKKQGDDILVNLASNEYFKSVKPRAVSGRIVTPQFKEKKNGSYKMIGIFAKRARGLMSRYIIRNQLTEPEDIKQFDLDDYQFNRSLSRDDQWVFTRG